jgi:hypothetical protein
MSFNMCDILGQLIDRVTMSQGLINVPLQVARQPQLQLPRPLIYA